MVNLPKRRCFDLFTFGQGAAPVLLEQRAGSTPAYLRPDASHSTRTLTDASGIISGQT